MSEQQQTKNQPFYNSPEYLNLNLYPNYFSVVVEAYMKRAKHDNMTIKQDNKLREDFTEFIWKEAIPIMNKYLQAMISKEFPSCIIRLRMNESNSRY